MIIPKLFIIYIEIQSYINVWAKAHTSFR